ncbi:MAG: NAD(P)H-dependent flavin oxidoreductase [Pseudorhodoplanes sp.]|uniref:NAD(P)H-dependent flavin oxidoreductase n=1 Tax=Pseudorhodoplanes sp. TaxID=1934341 RepID=UPI003D0EB051
MPWPDRRFTDLFNIEHPIVLAPMAGSIDHELAAEVAEAGGLGSIPCAMLDLEQMHDQVGKYRVRTRRPLNLNFFCHTPPELNNAREAAWRERLAPYYRELGIDPAAPVPSSNRRPFDQAICDLLLELKPEAASFHFGLPEPALFERVKRAGILTLSSATTVAEARWLEARGVDAIIAQGNEAGGHRGIFLGEDIATQPGTFALVPQVVDAVKVPVIAAGAVTDARGIAAAFMLGAAAVQVGTAFLFCPESKISAPHRAALQSARDDGTALTNLMTGRPARGLMNRLMRELGPISEAPAFPLAAGAIAPLRVKAEAAGSGDFTPLWSGQAAALGVEMPARALMAKLAGEAQALLRGS